MYCSYTADWVLCRGEPDRRLDLWATLAYFPVIKPTRRTNFTNLFCHKLYIFRTDRLPIIRSLFTVHSTMVYAIEVCRVSWQNKFVKLVRLLGFITGKFFEMHGHMNVKLWPTYAPRSVIFVGYPEDEGSKLLRRFDTLMAILNHPDSYPERLKSTFSFLGSPELPSFATI